MSTDYLLKPNPKIIRQLGIVEEAKDGPRVMQEVRERAWGYAKENKLEKPVIREFWSPWFGPGGYYPMRLLGPGSPKIETCEDALRHGPRAQFTVVIREASETNPT